MDLKDLEEHFSWRMAVQSTDPQSGKRLRLTGILERVDSNEVAVRATSMPGGNVEPYPDSGRVAIATITSLELA